MTKVKICGITNFEDAISAVELGADMIGFNFYKPSPRYISPKTACAIAEKIPATVLKVGVFVNMESYRVGKFVDMIALDAVQLHGDEDAAFVAEMRTETNAKIISVVRADPKPSIPVIGAGSADFVLVDTLSANGIYGGSGRTFDWTLVTNIDGLILAGGLNADNVGEAIRIVRPYAVDVASGVESSPGKKDAEKMRRFIEAVRNAG